MDAQKMLEDQGVELEDLVDAAFALYVGDKDKTEITRRKAMFRAKVRLNLQDQNVGMLLEAAIHLDKMISGETSGIFKGSADPSALVADELIGATEEVNLELPPESFVIDHRVFFEVIPKNESSPLRVAINTD